MEFKVVVSKNGQKFATGMSTELYIDGQLVQYAVGYSIGQEADGLQKVTIEFLPTSVVVETK